MFNGQCEEALNFYGKCLGARVLFKMTYGESPEANMCDAGMQKQIMHARLTIGQSIVMAADCPPQHYHKPQGFSLSLTIEKPEEAERVFHALADKGQVTMPIGETFWARRFGMLVDQFGIPWMVNCEKAEYQG
jgi:PhnB protein